MIVDASVLAATASNGSGADVPTTGEMLVQFLYTMARPLVVFLYTPPSANSAGDT
jgi:hypothetical protein